MSGQTKQEVCLEEVETPKALEKHSLSLETSSDNEEDDIIFNHIVNKRNELNV